ncbi:hypothetical protein EJD97_010037, partial [Solanum chilense]
MDLKFEQITRACSLFTFLVVAPSLLAVVGVGAAGCRLKLQLLGDLAVFGVEAAENQRREGQGRGFLCTVEAASIAAVHLLPSLAKGEEESEGVAPPIAGGCSLLVVAACHC